MAQVGQDRATQTKKRKTELDSSCHRSPPAVPEDHKRPRIVCDNCRHRRVRCDGEFPCKRCQHAQLTCKRDHVPRKRGPKPGHGKVIDDIRARDAHGDIELPCPNATAYAHTGDFFGGVSQAPSLTPSLTPTSPSSPWTDGSPSVNHGEPASPFSTDQFRPNARYHSDMISQLVDLYYEHIYPIMPLVYMPTIREVVARPMSPPEQRHIFALCALTAFHMSGKSINASSPALSCETGNPPAWEYIGRSFLDESISARQSYDYEDDFSLPAIIASFWTSTSFFEINQSRKSWYYLREALSLALDLGLDNEAKYIGLSPTEKLCRQRVFWILFVTERSFAILRRKPLTFTRTPSLPTEWHPYEEIDIHAGFLKLIASYTPLDTSFVNAWNDEEADPCISKTAFQKLQNILSQAPTSPTPSPVSSPIVGMKPHLDNPEPTTIQKADLLMTQQWLRLIVWQASLRQGLLSSHAEHPSMRFSFPLSVAHDTLAVLHALPAKAVEVHGMGMFEKIFEIASTCVSVMGASESMMGATGTSGELDVLGLARKQPLSNPVEFFISRLSASENSKHMFADRLLMLAREKPAALKLSLSPALRPPVGMTKQLEARCRNRMMGATSNDGAGLDVPNVKIEPDTEGSVVVPGACLSITPFLSFTTQTQVDCQNSGQDEAEEFAERADEKDIERSSSVCYANQFGAYMYGDSYAF